MINPTQSSLDALHTRLITSLKSSRFNDTIPILSELRDQMPQIVAMGPLYSHWLRIWMPTIKDILMDVNAVKKKVKDTTATKSSSKDGKDVKGVPTKEKEKKPHPYFVAPKHGWVRRCLLEILSKCPLNEAFHGHASTALSCCVNVLLVDYEDNALLALSLVFQIHKTYRLISPNSSNTTSISRMKGEEAKQLRECQVFLDFVCDCYRELTKSSGSSLEKNFDFGKITNLSAGGTPMSAGDPTKENIPSLLAKQSLRVLTECPLTITLLFQMYPKFLKTNIPGMIPFMMDSLKLVPPKFVDSSKGVGDAPISDNKTPKEGSTPVLPGINSEGKGKKETPVAETPKQPIGGNTPTTGISTLSAPANETLYRLYRIRALELLSGQVKTLSFLSYLLRAFADQMRPYEDVMANSIVCLMKNCPREAISTRRELFVATRSILATEFRKSFFRHIDIMMDERMIAGNSRYSTVEQSLRPLGYSMLAELIQHARIKMTPAQLGRAVRIFSRVLNDVGMNMPINLQTTSVRLLLQLVDPIFHNNDPNPQTGRDMLFRILRAYVQKLRIISTTISELSEKVEKEIRDGLQDISITKKYDSDGESYSNSSIATLREIQSLLRPMFLGMKTIVWCIDNYAQQREKERQRVLISGEEQFPLAPFAVARENEEVNSALMKMTHGECELVAEYITLSLPCLGAFRFTFEPEKIVAPTKSESPPAQYREMTEAFAASFSFCLSENGEFSKIKRTFVQELSSIMKEMDKDPGLIFIFKHLLFASGKSVSYEVCSLLVPFLLEHIAALDDFQTTPENSLEESHIESTCSAHPTSNLSTRGKHHFELFITLISSLSKYPKNELALLPYLNTIVSQCIRRSMVLKFWPGPYLCIIRMLFRAITAGKFEASYREMGPLMPSLLNGFYRIFFATADDPLRSMIIELMLTLPARMTTLLPHLPLIVKVIIPALQSNKGELVNLGLRTLEFWVDNLHPDYIYPVLSQSSDTLCELMISLQAHLKPAPYPYGLLCMRLLGKLGGRNRLFLHEVTSQDEENIVTAPGLSMLFEWQQKQPNSESHNNSLAIRLPLEHAVDILQRVADAPNFVAKKDSTMNVELPCNPHSAYVEGLFHKYAECLDLNSHAVDLMNNIKSEQANSAFAIIRGALSSIVDLSDKNNIVYFSKPDTIPTEVHQSTPDTKESVIHSDNIASTAALKLICDGLFIATSIDELEKEATMLLKGIGSYTLFLIESHIDCITRIDCDGAAVDNTNQANFVQNHLSGGKLQPLSPYGCFRLSSPLSDGVDPFVFNESLAHAMSDPKSKPCLSKQNASPQVMSFMLETIKKIKNNLPEMEDGHPTNFGDIFSEQLLRSLCQKCFTQSWNRRSGLMIAIVELLKKMGLKWSQLFEAEILHLALFALKDTPAEITAANKEALEFFMVITLFFFGAPLSWGPSTKIHDSLSGTLTFNNHEVDTEVTSIRHDSLTLVISELGSTKQLVRYAVRLFLRIISRDNMSLDSLIKNDVSSLKRLVFPRILRNSPLPEQVSIVESIAFMMDRSPSLFSIEDQTCLSFTAELLKMVSVADGDISDTMSCVVLIDKNGFAAKNDSSNQQAKTRMHTSSLFLRRKFILEIESFGGIFVVPEELPLGVQLRIASIFLFRSVIRKFPTQFFDSEPKSQVGNLRPHIVSFLFRSLTSEAVEVVSAAESALNDVLLSEAEHDEATENESRQSAHRLPKELIQACIRPILMNLKDHKKLTLPLLRGVSRLLVLLTSWFNKSLGEKMLEHLYKFIERDKIVDLRLWKAGEESKVIAAVIDLFSLLPQASRFVEVLIKIILRLEAVWKEPRPIFRIPLAQYLNRHPASAIGFFIQEHRLNNPVYSELFTDILQMESTKDLRIFIRSKESSVMLLNVCFERPLAIIRSEKNHTSSLVLGDLEVYGINPMNSYSTQRKLEGQRHEIMVKKNQLAKSKPEDQSNTHPTSRDKLERDLESLRVSYSREISQVNDLPTERPMTVSALELQHQGFKIIGILAKLNQHHFNLEEQKDVVRALRWLWRSRGRHYRLLNEEEIQPRYYTESLTLANLLVSYSEANLEDIDVLFDLVRIFLNTTSINFTFVNDFIQRRVTVQLSPKQKEQLFQRYLTLLSSEGSEENKVISTSVLVLPMLKHVLEVNDTSSTKTVLSDASVRKLMMSIFHGSFSSKLVCQLLRLINVLLEHMHDNIVEYRKDMMKYVWGILKSDDGSTKYYGYLAVSRFVQVFETPAKVTLQVYRALLRAHNTPERSMVRAALNLLVPSLTVRLSSDELDVALKYTIKVIQEEGTSIQQIAHVLECITCHSDIYSPYSSVLIPLMVHALSVLGVSQNPELKELSIATVKLISEWSETKRSSDQDNYQHISDSTVNFLIKLVLLNAEVKSDSATRQIHFKAISLLKSVLLLHPNTIVRESLFEKCFVTDSEEIESQRPTKSRQAKTVSVSNKGEKNKKTSSHKGSATQVNHNTERLAPTVVISSLEILLILLSCNSHNALSRLNIFKIVSACFLHDSSIKNKEIQEKLKACMTKLVSSSIPSPNYRVLITLLEDAICAASRAPNAKPEEYEKITKRGYLAVDLIENICTSYPGFIEPFTCALSFLAKKLVRDHIRENPRNTTPLPPATSTLGIFELACGIGFHAPKNKEFTSSYRSTESQIFFESENLSEPLRALVQSLRLLSHSTILSTFSPTRMTFLDTLTVLLDSSSCIPILMTVLRIVGEIVTKDSQFDHLTRSEKEEFLFRTTQIDFDRLPAATGQVVLDMVCSIVLSTHGYGSSAFSDHNESKKHSPPSTLLNKILPICFMSGNTTIRSMALLIFTTGTQESNFAQQNMPSFAATIPLIQNNHHDVFSIPCKCPHAVISQLLQSNLECIGKRMWTVVLVDLLLAIGRQDGALHLVNQGSLSHQGCSRLPRLKLAGENLNEIDLNALACEEYSAFVKHILLEKDEAHCGMKRCVFALRNIIHVDVALNQFILEDCVQATWQQLPSNEERLPFIKLFETIIAMPYHSQFLKTNQCAGPKNVIQSIFWLLINLQPYPTIDTFLLSSLAGDYSVPYEALAYLEKRYLILQQNGLGESQECNTVLRRIYELYAYLGDRDVTIAMSSAMCSMHGTKFALSLDMYGDVKKSTDAYLALIDRADANDKFMPPEYECDLWSQRWIEAHKQLSQWPLIDELATTLQDTHLMIESALKTHNFDNVKSLYGSPSVIASIESADLQTKLTEVALAIHEGKLTDIENLHAQAAQICLYKWQLLPNVKAGSGAHKELYQQFQRLVELKESSQIMTESTSHSSRRSIPDFKTVLSSWRHRNPNVFEPMSVWEDLYSWRLYVFDTVAKLFSWTESSTLATLHDRPIALITMGRIARKQDMKELSICLLKDLSDCMDIKDAFLKLREQIITYQDASDGDTLKGGLNLVNSTNLTFFDAQQTAEIFRLKSYFFSEMNHKSNAHKNYCHTVQICPSYSRSWLDWGNLCSSLDKSSSDETKEAKRKKTLQYKAQAMGCYLEAIRCDANEKSREYIPQCISMLSLDSSQYGYLFKAFESRAPLSPAWVWLPWIPQLLTSLCREEAHSVKTVLNGIVSDHPQAIYFNLRAFFLERRDIERSKDQSSGSKLEEDAQKHAEILMSTLRKLHPVLWSRLEAILEDLIIRFRPSYESELLATIKALLEKAKAKSGKDDSSDSNIALLESLRGNLSKISQKFFNKDKAESSKGRKTLLFEKKWHAAFDSDFVDGNAGEDGTHQSGSIDGLIKKLESWKETLECHVSLIPNQCYLQETSPSLSWYSAQSCDLWPGACESASLSLSNSQHDYQTSLDNSLYEATKLSALAAHKTSAEAIVSAAKAEGLGGHESGGSALVEIPGQYAPTSRNVLDMRPFPELHAKLVNFHQTLEVISSSFKQDQSVRQITMLGSDGKSYKFSLQLAIPYWTRTDERSAQLQYIMNKIVRSDIQTCRRGLSMRPNVVIPVAQRMRMTAHESSCTSLDSVFHHIKGPKAYEISSFFDEEMEKRISGTETDHQSPQVIEKVKLEVYQHICKEHVSPSTLSKYMMEVIPSIENLMQYRKAFASQLAMNSVIQHAFAVIERTPSRFVFCNRSGQVLCQDFRFQYNQGLLEAHDVPFRMTRNITDFIGPFLLEGSFIPSFVCTSSALHAKKSALEPILHLLLRDDIISWYISKTQPRNDKKIQEMEHQLFERVRKNIDYVQTRLEECSARHVENAGEEAVSENPQPVDVHVRSLVDVATNQGKLCLMPSSYQAWL